MLVADGHFSTFNDLLKGSINSMTRLV